MSNWLSQLLRPRDRSSSSPLASSEFTWWRLPSFRQSGYLYSIVGESHYQDAIERACGGRDQEGAVRPLVTAVLMPEPKNRHDSRAIRVTIAGRTVGYIPRHETNLFHPALRTLATTQRLASCRAWIRGGWNRGRRDKGSFGVSLDLDEHLTIGNDVLLPFGESRISVVEDPAQSALLMNLLAGQKRAEITAELILDEDVIRVVMGDANLGTLTAKMSARYAAWVRTAASMNLKATTHARVILGERKPEVFLKLAHPRQVDRSTPQTPVRHP